MYNKAYLVDTSLHTTRIIYMTKIKSQKRHISRFKLRRDIDLML